MDEHGIIWRCNFKEGARDEIGTKDVDFKSLPPVGRLRLCHRDNIGHEACIVDQLVDMANGLKAASTAFSSVLSATKVGTLVCGNEASMPFLAAKSVFSVRPEMAIVGAPATAKLRVTSRSMPVPPPDK